MFESLKTLLYKLRFVFAGLFIVGNFFLLSILISEVSDNHVQAKSSNSTNMAMAMSDSPNVVTSSLVSITSEVGEALGSAAYIVNGGIQSASSAIAEGAKNVVGGTKKGAVASARGIGKVVGSVGHGVGDGFGLVGRGVGNSVAFVFQLPGRALGAVSNTAMANAVIRPDDHEFEEVPIIDPNSPELIAALAALPAEASSPKASKSDSGPAWPMHGEISVAFGVPHRPYQQTHTGIDIIDHQRSGVTPITPFRPGRVIGTVYSRYGYGNHVIIDHGNGVTSLYAHLASISVKAGQEVSLSTKLGYEGSTGLSTGVHLHFEIRVNGQAADPRKFISGNP